MDNRRAERGETAESATQECFNPVTARAAPPDRFCEAELANWKPFRGETHSLGVDPVLNRDIFETSLDQTDREGGWFP